MRMHSQENAGGALRPDISHLISFRVHPFAPAVGAPLDGTRACADQRAISRHPQRGSLILVVLCLLAVLGIALASFLAVSTQSMKLSNRSFQTTRSAQLAEMGLELSLDAFNRNDWSNWTNSSGGALTTSDTAAYRTVTLAASQLGQGVTGTIKLRVDNYNANQLNSTWSSSANYRTNDLIGYSGMWYRCVIQNSGQTPSGTSAYWIQEQSPINWTWTASTNYVAGNMVYRDNTWYRCTSPHISPTTWTGANWTAIGPIKLYSPSDYHTTGDIFYYPNSTTWFYVHSSGTPGSFIEASSAHIFWKWSNSIPYFVGDVVYYYTSPSGPGHWYRCIVDHTGQIPSTSSSYWTDSQSSSAMTSTNNLGAWSNGANYNLNDVVYYSGSWYRCILAHPPSRTPSSSPTYWANTPRFSVNWNSGKQYSQNDTVRYNGKWYLSLANSNYGHTPPTASPYYDSYWASTDDTTRQWNPSTSYSLGVYRSYGGVWYKCLSAGSSKSPNNSSYWTASWKNSWQPNSTDAMGAPVIYAEGTVTLPDGSPAIKTQLRASIAPAPLFPNAAAASSNLTISTGTGTVDSYDSASGAYSAPGGASAVLAAGSTLAISGTTAISGYLAWPSPPSGITGTINGQSIDSDKSHVSRSPYIPKFDCLPGPTTTSPNRNLSSAFSNWDFPYGNDLSSILTTTTNIGIAGATTPIRYYYSPGTSLNIGSSYICSTLNINGPVILYINGNLRVRSDGVININSTGSAEIHADGGIRTDNGASGGWIENFTQDPKKLVLISDVSSTSTQYLRNSTKDFYGVFYAPNTTTTLGLQIQNSPQIYGALSAKNITFSNAANVHYDTSLRYATIPGVDQPWAVAEWRELTDPAERAVLP